MTQLDGKGAVVTGASGGIGAAIAARLAAEGAHVVVGWSSNSDGAREVVDKIHTQGGAAVAVQADLASAAEVGALFARADEELPGVDIVINNAGIIVPAAVAEVTEADYDRVMAVNARGVLFAMQEAARRMGEGGRIVNISSINTAMSPPGSAVYSASKAAVEQFTRVAAKELGGLGVTVNAVSPGATDTGMFTQAPPERRQMAVAMSALGRLGEAEDIADVVAFLCTDQARWITGQILAVNGGMA